jgi:hypothetical protein
MDIIQQYNLEMSEAIRSHSYYPELKHFLLFLGRKELLDSKEITSKDLVDISPEDVCMYMNHKAYGKRFPQEEDLPIHARSHSLKASKTKLSAFMPRKNAPWDEIRKEGNPTRSVAVNALIKRVMKFEVRRQGVKSQARRPIEFLEFENLLTIIRKESHYKEIERYRLSSILTLQWHLIGRVDDMMKLQFENLSYNPSHPFTLISQMRWSKNICEERESPRQLLVASMDDRLCVLLNLAVYLELWGEIHTPENTFVFGQGTDGDKNVRNLIQFAFECSEFKKLIGGNLGTHSMRKGPATYCARNGISKDVIEVRGRWRSSKRQVDTYIDVERPMPDTRVACCLCGPRGPIKYEVREEFKWLTGNFLSNVIAPNIKKLAGPNIASTLGKTLLYAAINKISNVDNTFVLLPTTLRSRIIQNIMSAGAFDLRLSLVYLL